MPELVRNGVALGHREPPFIYGSCGAGVTSSPSRGALFVLPALAIVYVALYLSKTALVWLGANDEIQILVGISLAIIGSGWGTRILRKSFVYRTWRGHENA